MPGALVAEVMFRLIEVLLAEVALVEIVKLLVTEVFKL
jgi:hypothetical protein